MLNNLNTTNSNHTTTLLISLPGDSPNIVHSKYSNINVRVLNFNIASPVCSLCNKRLQKPRRHHKNECAEILLKVLDLCHHATLGWTHESYNIPVYSVDNEMCFSYSHCTMISREFHHNLYLIQVFAVYIKSYLKTKSLPYHRVCCSLSFPTITTGLKRFCETLWQAYFKGI